MEVKHRFPYKWKISETKFTKDKGTVFSCFACGGGSSFGYKLAGFDVLGCNEIDPKMMEAYKANHNPKYAYLEPIQSFKLRKDLPKELYELDILDGSPPCSSFSMAGNREKDWGKEKVFREGQAKQVLDTLFFDFIDLAKELQPKVVIAENVKGLLLGNAKEYVRKIYKEFDQAGYYCQHWLLDASKMGVPQRRERVFFICLRKDLAEPFLYQQDMFTVNPKLELNFNEPEIPFGEIDQNNKGKKIRKAEEKRWEESHRHTGRYDTRGIEEGGHRFGYQYRAYKKLVFPTLTANGSYIYGDRKEYIVDEDLYKISSFPTDYITEKAQYICGMSVPPVAMANISEQIYEQWLSKL